MAATVPPVDEHAGKLGPSADPMDSDMDAEGEEETDLYDMDQQLQDAVHRAFNGEVAEEDGDSAVGEIARDANREQNGGDNDETEPVGAVKLPDEDGSESSEGEDADYEAVDADADPAFDEDNDREASESDSSDASEAEEDWEAESNGREDADTDIRSRATCM